MNIGSPVAIFSIIYIDISQSDIRVKNEVNFITFSAVVSEKMRHRVHLSILPPSKELSGNRLKIERQSEIIEKGKRKFWQKGIAKFENENLKVRAKPKNPIRGPPKANNNSST